MNGVAISPAARPDEANRFVYESVAPAYGGERALQPAERAVLERLRDHLADASMLDLGVGGGRTVHAFEPAVRDYVGLDYAAAMIEVCRREIGEDGRRRFAVGDARDLSSFGERTFGFVLFSFNGIDSVGHEDRARVLAEVRRVLRPDGWFAFVSHSLAALPFRPEPEGLTPRQPLRSGWRLARAMRQARQLRAVNGELDLDTARARGWAAVRDTGHDFRLLNLYVDPLAQAAQLGRAGFVLEAVYDRSGSPVDPARPGRDPWLLYLCRPGARPESY